MYRLNEQDPFVQMIFRSVVVTAVCVFIAAYAMDITVPQVRRPLFVPLGAALLCGSLAFQVEIAQKQYVLAILEFLAALALFLGLGWASLAILHVSYQARAADVISLLPVVIAGERFFFFVRMRYKRGIKQAST